MMQIRNSQNLKIISVEMEYLKILDSQKFTSKSLRSIIKILIGENQIEYCRNFWSPMLNFISKTRLL